MSAMHPVGTCKMDREDDDQACVTADFKVRGVKGLRVMDLSVALVLLCTHTQRTAYLMGKVVAEKMLEEYGW